MADPNTAFKQRNDGDDTGWSEITSISIIYGSGKDLHMTCRSCGFTQVLHIEPHKAFKPSDVICECGKHNWKWAL